MSITPSCQRPEGTMLSPHYDRKRARCVPGLPWTLGARPWGAGPAPTPFSRALWLRPPARPFPTQRGKPGHPLSTQQGRAAGRARGHGPAVKTYLEQERRGFLPPSSALLCGPTTRLSTRLPISTPPRPPFPPALSVHQPAATGSPTRAARLKRCQGQSREHEPSQPWGSCLRASPSAPAPVNGPVPMPRCSGAQRKK